MIFSSTFLSRKFEKHWLHSTQHVWISRLFTEAGTNNLFDCSLLIKAKNNVFKQVITFHYWKTNVNEMLFTMVSLRTTHEFKISTHFACRLTRIAIERTSRQNLVSTRIFLPSLKFSWFISVPSIFLNGQWI